MSAFFGLNNVTKLAIKIIKKIPFYPPFTKGDFSPLSRGD